MTPPTIHPTSDQFERLAGSTSDAPIVMLNLLRFKDVADGVDEADGISGEEAYQRYGAAVASNLAEAGGTVLTMATCSETVIGPADERWDLCLLVRYPSRAAFLRMVSDPDYLAKNEHRTAGVDDSRLICCEQLEGTPLVT